MKRLGATAVLVLCFVACEFSAYSQTASVERPRILSIDHVSFYTTHAEAVSKLYSGTLGLAATSAIEPGSPEAILA